jgi:ATP phosphoribosyltransferase
MFTSSTVLRVAVQKSGRLSEKSLDIISGCGIDFTSGSRVLKSMAENFPVEFLYLRDDDIPGYVYDGIAEVGIVGRNEADEKGFDVEVVRDLGFSKCRLSIAVPNSFDYKGLSDLEGKQIATSYPNLLKNCLAEAKVSADIHEISGSVEIAPTIGLTDAIFDIVSTGSTLISNGLREVETLYRSSAVMIARKGLPTREPEKQKILERLLMRIDAVMRARHYKYIMFNLPSRKVPEVSKIIPGVKSPTVTPLLDEDWSSVQTVVQEDDFWEVFEALKAIGAQGILVTGIEQMTL